MRRQETGMNRLRDENAKLLDENKALLQANRSLKKQVQRFEGDLADAVSASKDLRDMVRNWLRADKALRTLGQAKG